MPRFRLHLRRIGWLALVAMLGLALAPTLSHALALAQGDGLVRADICTLQGGGRAAPDGPAGDEGAPAAFGHALVHCPYCAQGADAPVLAGALRAAAATCGACAGPARAGRQGPTARPVRVAAQPRAPPRRS